MFGGVLAAFSGRLRRMLGALGGTLGVLVTVGVQPCDLAIIAIRAAHATGIRIPSEDDGRVGEDFVAALEEAAAHGE